MSCQPFQSGFPPESIPTTSIQRRQINRPYVDDGYDHGQTSTSSSAEKQFNCLNRSRPFRKLATTPSDIGTRLTAEDIQTDLHIPATAKTVRTNVTTKTATAKRNATQPAKRIMAITESKGVAIEIGICIFDVNSCEVVISQLADSPTFTRTLQKVNLNDPQKILMPFYSTDQVDYCQRQSFSTRNGHQDAHTPPHTDPSDTSVFTVTSGSKLRKFLQLQFPHIPIQSISRKHFNDEYGKQCIQNFSLQEDTAGLVIGVSNKYYCLAAIACVFCYISDTEGYTFAEHTIKFTYQGAEGSMLIDTITAKNLELVTNIANNTNSGGGQNASSKKDTLLGILDHTNTLMGKRLLRMNILQPPCASAIIKDRLDVVENLCQSEETIFSIQSLLKQLNDLDHSISYLVKVPYASNSRATTTTLAVQYGEMKVNQTIALKQTIKTVQALAASLAQQRDSTEMERGMMQSDEISSSILLNTIYKILSNPTFACLEQEINSVINEEVGIQKTSLGVRNQKCYAVKAGVNGLLDVARQAYKETTEDIYELISKYSETYQMQMKLQFNASNGFHITMSTNQLTEGKRLPQEFINVVKKKKTLQFTSLELLQKNERLNESLTEVYLMSDKIVTELLRTFRDNINIFYQASEAIALLDMLTSFAAHVANSEEYVRPEFSTTLAIKSGRHPILDRILSFPMVPNDTFASLSSSFQFITGPNMSGKSTYLRQVALLTIMAQIGCFVPAEYACFRLSDQLLSRLANDNTFSDIGTSSFMSEMRETAYLLKNVTNTSIVLIDELGRGTSPKDALGITAAVCEELISTRAYCFFATHLHELTKTLNIYPNVVNLHFPVNVTRNMDNDCIVEYQYKIADGNLETNNHYGLQTAQILGLPKEVLACAHKIVTELKEHKAVLNRQIKDDGGHDSLTKERRLLWFADKLLQFGQTEMSNNKLYDHVFELQKTIIEATRHDEKSRGRSDCDVEFYSNENDMNEMDVDY